METISNIADYVVIGLPLIVLSRLWHFKMVNRYRFFVLMLIIEIIRDVLLRRINWNDPLYDSVWLASLFPWLLVQIAAVTAAHHDLAKLYTGAGRFAGWFCLCAIGIGLCASLGVNAQVDRNALYFLPWTVVGLCLEQSVALVLLAAMAIIQITLMYFPQPLKKMPKNIKAHLFILAGYFAVTALLDMSASLYIGETGRQDYMRISQVVSQALFCLCYAAWIALISKDGDDSAVWPDFHPEFKERLYRAHERMQRIIRKRLVVD